MPKKISTSDFLFIANHRCLDFLNTELTKWTPVVDLLGDFSDLARWLARAELLSSEEAHRALARWGGKPEGRHALEQAREFRRVLRDELVERVTQGKPVGRYAVEQINRHLRHCCGYPQLLPTEGGFETVFHVDYQEPVQLIGPVAESAVSLLHDCDFSLIKRCENPTCMLYFYDMSKNRARRWCCMTLCGNRMKAAAHYRRRCREGRVGDGEQRLV